MSNSLYERLKAAGHDMGWYERLKRTENKSPDGGIPLTDDHCGLLSIYLMDKTGKLWSTTSTGTPYMIIRRTKMRPKKDMFLCAACSKQFNTYKEASGHYGKADDQTTSN